MNPTVAAVMLVNGRPEMVRRAVEAFEAQTYQAKRLLILDGGEPLVPNYNTHDSILHVEPIRAGSTIGELRNYANSIPNEDIIVHWDSDDFSHPNRIAEQVALLQASGADCVGYREMLFWRFVRCRCPSSTFDYPDSVGHWGRMLRCCHAPYCPRSSDETGDEAWIYTNPDPDFCLGTSLCYWRHVWERKPFEALPVAPGGTGEDWKFQQGLKRTAVSALGDNPRMIASIHGGNTSDYSIIGNPQQRSFRRAPEWDEYCRKVMEG